ncbi:hypothetical protein BDK51DRAFT_40686 [Blyttiomyces helicus]|uniref:TAP-like protein-domain-containing protein n=1 Tax=Blyttiomyces helicus TaxID=388810 RepID=A0A4P9WAQ8_9FUNG|nr:hypothetical protein BDK51DRAFT_40686 [Blyttiomyces helicus]|eukprot:RKO89689.1 hypothetical protein BDK51DRAFT_40686 [Blyttiomyces helicus]
MAITSTDTSPLLGAPSGNSRSDPGDSSPRGSVPARWAKFGTFIGLFAGVALWAPLAARDIFPPATPSPNHTVPALPRRDNLHWDPCGDLDCSTFAVPLNHSDPTGRPITLALIRHKATAEPYLGALFVNPGGPGGSGIDMVKNAGAKLSLLLGEGRYDVIGFDPRGIGRSTPVTCFDSAASHAAFAVNVGTFPRPGDVADEALHAMRAKVRAELCLKKAGDLLLFTTTTAVARDLDLLREAFGEQLLNFYGYSYGTILGSTYVNMFPEHVGRVIVDAVVDPRHHSGTIFDSIDGGLINADAAVDAMAAACEEAGHGRCAMAAAPQNVSRSHPRTSPSVISRIRNLLTSLETNPLPAPNAAVPGVLTAELARSVVFISTYQTTWWPAAMEALSQAEKGDGTLLLNMAVQAPADACPTTDSLGEEGFLAVACVDQTTNGIVDFAGFKDGVAKAENTSYFGGREWSYGSLPCLYWGVKPHEVFRGPWNHVTKNKILIIGTTFDPVTPVESAEALEELMEGSGVFLRHVGHGHGSNGQPSPCTIQVIRDYMVRGITPRKGTFCTADDSLLYQPSFSALGAQFPEDVRAAIEVGEAIHAAGAVRRRG